MIVKISGSEIMSIKVVVADNWRRVVLSKYLNNNKENTKDEDIATIHNNPIITFEVPKPDISCIVKKLGRK